MAAVTPKPQVQALLFDVYGTLFDVRSLEGACEEAFPGQGEELSRLWRVKQLEYTYLLSLMERFQDFWQVSGTALVFACQPLGLECTPEVRERLQDQYFRLEPFPDVPESLAALSGYPLYILSNGSPRCCTRWSRTPASRNTSPGLSAPAKCKNTSPVRLSTVGGRKRLAWTRPGRAWSRATPGM